MVSPTTPSPHMPGRCKCCDVAYALRAEPLRCPHCGKTIRNVQHAVNEVGRLEAENEHLRAALEAIASVDTWMPESVLIQTARHALGRS